jgi:anti-anti-sigma factor
MTLTLSTGSTGRSATVHVGGDLDFQSTDQLLAAVSGLLTDDPAPSDLHLDFADLAFCDSAGLSALLLIHRKTCAAGVELHLDRRPAHLERILDITGVREYLTTRPTPDAPSESGIV